MKKICITGANGFIGQSIYKTLLKEGRSCIGTVRSINFNSSNYNNKYIQLGDIGPNTNWKVALRGVDCVVHCAGRAHFKKNIRYDEKKFFNTVNFNGTKQLAQQAAEVGVKRLVFLSSIGVLGNNTNNRKPFTQSDKPNPVESYAISKYEAEQALFEISTNTGLEIVIIRAPLVYGPSAPGNLGRLIKIINTGLPLPFSHINNRRSLIGIKNLVDLVIRCIDHPNAKGKIFLVSDGEDLSTPNLIQLIASSMGKTSHFFPIPISLLRILARIIGKQRDFDRLSGSLRIDNSYTKKILNWTPPVSVEEGIRRMVQGK